jgi:hypothetical protein
MKNFNWKALFLTCICAVFMVIGATDTFAYRTFGEGCHNCHNDVDQFKGPGEPLHDDHQAFLSDCSSTLCHFSVSLNSGTGCVGCHGRSEDAGNDDTYPGLGAGLRQFHYDDGTTGCANCHDDANPANYTPVGEHVLPPFYTAESLDPCNDNLDNDGDGVKDFCNTNMIYGTISGDIQAGVTVDIYILNCGLSDTNVGPIVTNAAGYYEIGGLEIGQYDVYPNETNFSFVPAAFWAYIPNLTGQSYDFTSTAD